MAFNARVVRVLISSPGDTGRQRDAIEAALHAWNSSRAEQVQCLLLPTRWESHVPMLGTSPQDLINKDLVDRCDIVVAIFDTRLGTPTGVALSGTAEEIERANRARKPVHVYFSRDALPRDVDTQQLDGLRRFEDGLRPLGLLGYFETQEQLAAKVLEAVEHDLPRLEPIMTTREFWLSRDDATPSMEWDMSSASDMVFLGISNTSLAAYIHEVISNAQGTLPWRQIDVYFAEESVGRIWEGSGFIDIRTESMLGIWHVLREATSRIAPGRLTVMLPDLERVTFRIGSGENYFNGSLFRYPSDAFMPEDVYSNIYVVFSMPTPPSDAKKSATIRLSSNTGDLVTARYHESFTKAYESVLTASPVLLTRSPRDIWDDSAGAWYNFEAHAQSPGSRGSIYLKSMAELASFAKLPFDASVVDIGAGTGQASSILADAIPSGKLTMLDSSPEMVRIAKRVLQSRTNVQHVIGDVERGLNACTPPEGFGAAVVHFSLQWIVGDGYSLNKFAGDLNRSLAPGGQVILAIHNTALTDDSFAYYAKENDPLRNALAEAARVRGYCVIEDGATSVFSEQEVRTAFRSACFKYGGRKVFSLARTMKDRLLMWRTPAILRCIVSDRLTEPQIAELLDAVSVEVIGDRTPDTQVLLLKFKKPPTGAPATSDTREGTA